MQEKVEALTVKLDAIQSGKTVPADEVDGTVKSAGKSKGMVVSARLKDLYGENR